MDPVRKHERRLRAAFQRALLLAMAAAVALQACGDDTVVGGSGADAGDATVDDAVGETSWSPDAAEEAGPLDAGALDADSGLLRADAPGGDAQDASPSPDATADSPDEASDASSFWCSDASTGAPWWPDASGNCKYFVDLSCPAYVPAGGCLIGGNDCLTVCSLNTPLFDCEYAPNTCNVAGHFLAEAGQPVTIQCDVCPGAGRRPAGLRRRIPPKRVRSIVGEYFAQAAYLEAASVHAFDRLARELRAHRAPRCLVAAAERAAEEEVRHAEIMGAFATRHGAATSKPRIPRCPIRPLERVARENAVEGCVRETYGALLATWQAAHAADPAFRRAVRRIAADETRHAALSWAVAEWAEGRLHPGGRALVARARTHALRRLGTELAKDPDRTLGREAGLPSARQSRALLAQFAADIRRSEAIPTRQLPRRARERGCRPGSS